MSLRELVVSLIQEEMSRGARPDLREATVAPLLPDRKAIFATLTSLAERQRKIDQSQTDGLDDEARLAQLEAEMLSVRNRILSRNSALYLERLETSFAIERAQSLLRGTCSPQLNAFIDSMNDEVERLRCLEPSTEIEYGEKNLLDDNPKTSRACFSNSPAICRRILAAVDARSRAEDLKLVDLTEDKLEKKLDGLRLALPIIEGQMERVVAN